MFLITIEISMQKEKVILGIDPGTNIMGYAVITTQGSKIILQSAGVLQMEKLGDHYLKLNKIFEKMLMLIDSYHPDELAIEAPFFGKNVQSMLKLGRAQGVAIAAALHRQIPVYEYSPRKIKQAVTGRGAASKEQVAAMLQQQIGFTTQPKYLDATDALATAVCHSYQSKFALTAKPLSGWKAYLTNHPDKIL